MSPKDQNVHQTNALVEGSTRLPPCTDPQSESLSVLLVRELLEAVADVQELAEPGFNFDVAIIPAAEWRAFVDKVAGVQNAWSAWEWSPYRISAPAIDDMKAVRDAVQKGGRG